jgi:hypothetical protein
LRNRNTLEYIGIWEKELTSQQTSVIYAGEADVLNMAHLQNPVFGDKQKQANIAVNIRRLITTFHLSLTAVNPFPGRD